MTLKASDIKYQVHILFADDDIETLALMKWKCESLGWVGKYVSNAVEIIEAFNASETRFDAVVTDINFSRDINFPSVTGISAAREIRKISKNVPIIFVSAYGNSMIREEARRVNAEIVDKPIENINKFFDDLARLIRWYRGATGRYDGPERRKVSINRTDYRRRVTDRLIVPSKTIQAVISMGEINER